PGSSHNACRPRPKKGKHRVGPPVHMHSLDIFQTNTEGPHSLTENAQEVLSHNNENSCGSIVTDPCSHSARESLSMSEAFKTQNFDEDLLENEEDEISIHQVECFEDCPRPIRVGQVGTRFRG